MDLLTGVTLLQLFTVVEHSGDGRGGGGGGGGGGGMVGIDQETKRQVRIAVYYSLR